MNWILGLLNGAHWAGMFFIGMAFGGWLVGFFIVKGNEATIRWNNLEITRLRAALRIKVRGLTVSTHPSGAVTVGPESECQSCLAKESEVLRLRATLVHEGEFDEEGWPIIEEESSIEDEVFGSPV